MSRKPQSEEGGRDFSGPGASHETLTPEWSPWAGFRPVDPGGPHAGADQMSLLKLFRRQPRGICTSSWAGKLCVGLSRKASEEAEGRQFPVERAGAQSPAGDPRPRSVPPKALWAVLESKPHQGQDSQQPSASDPPRALQNPRTRERAWTSQSLRRRPIPSLTAESRLKRSRSPQAVPVTPLSHPIFLGYNQKLDLRLPLGAARPRLQQALLACRKAALGLWPLHAVEPAPACSKPCTPWGQ